MHTLSIWNTFWFLATDEPYPKNCNMTVMLTSVRPKDVIMSPSYPDPYPDNMDCTITLTAQLGQKIVLTFSTFILEDGNGQL